MQGVTYQEYENQPDVARSDVYAALYRGFREGLLLGRNQVLDEALKFAAEVTTYFKKTRYNDFVNKWGEGRLSELVGDLDESVRDVFLRVLSDPSMPLLDRLIIYSRANEAQRRMVYDELKPVLEAEFAREPISQSVPFAQAFPEPPGMTEHRAQRAAEAAAAENEKTEGARSDFERK